MQLAILLLLFVFSDCQPEVRIKNGSVLLKGIDVEEVGVSCFLSIPYARPPVGKLRFKPPREDLERMESPWNASAFRAICPQDWEYLSEAAKASSTLPESEDCLYLNVFTPTKKGPELLPVMFWIHGGAFVSGSAANYRPHGIASNLVSRGVVVVTIQYRLTIFGFFTTLTSEFPANLGLLDQIAALHWVQREIREFGGDPNRVTIFGESAGGASVSLLSLTPLARGLFHQALMQSGTGFCPWAVDGNRNRFIGASRMIAIKTGCSTEKQWDAKDFSSMGECLRNLTWDQLKKFTWNETLDSSGLWKPIIDGIVFPDQLRNLAKNRKKNMPILIGTTRDEALDEFLSLFDDEDLFLDNFTRKFTQGCVRLIVKGKSWRDPKAVYRILKKFYLDYPYHEKDHHFWYNITIQMFSDPNFFAPTSLELDFLLQTTPNIFVYSFDHVPLAYPWPEDEIEGVSHSMDLYYVFNMSKVAAPDLCLPKFNFSAQDFEVADLAGKMWTNFAKSGNPNLPMKLGAEWRRYERPQDLRPFYHIAENPETRHGYHKRASNLWNYILPTASSGSFPPTSALLLILITTTLI